MTNLLELAILLMGVGCVIMIIANTQLSTRNNQMRDLLVQQVLATKDTMEDLLDDMSMVLDHVDENKREGVLNELNRRSDERIKEMLSTEGNSIREKTS